MKSLVFNTLFAASVLSCSFQAIAQEQEPTQALQQLTTQEQAEYSNKLRDAGSDAEREKITAQYQEMAQQRSRHQTGKGIKYGQSSSGASTGQGQGNPNMGGETGPAGSKNKPQKSGC